MKLDQIIPNENIRRVVYVVFGVLGLGLGVFQTVYASMEQDQPAWLTASFAVYAYLAAAGFTVSTVNTPSTVLPTAEETVLPEDPANVGFEEEYPQEVPTAGADPVETARHAA